MPESVINMRYSRKSMALTLMALLPGLFQTRSRVPKKKFHDSCSYYYMWNNLW